jgi:hypothetical protein
LFKEKVMPHIRIFPHSQEEFPSLDALQTWLMTALKARSGRYLLRSRKAVAELPMGSIVLFRYADDVVGEGVVREYVRESHTGRTLTGEEQQYEAQVTFAPDSIRLFAPPVTVEELQRIVGEALPIMIPNGYYIIRDWGVYPKLLAGHVGRAGAFV